MHYSGLDPAAYGSNAPNVTVMNRGTTAAAMQAAWSQNPAASCRYNPAQTADYMAAAATGTPFGADSVSSFYQDSYRHHPLISASSAMPSVYYPTTHPMLMQSRSMTSPTELSVSNPSPTAANGQNQPQELASPTDSLGSKGRLHNRTHIPQGLTQQFYTYDVNMCHILTKILFSWFVLQLCARSFSQAKFWLVTCKIIAKDMVSSKLHIMTYGSWSPKFKFKLQHVAVTCVCRYVTLNIANKYL